MRAGGPGREGRRVGGRRGRCAVGALAIGPEERREAFVDRFQPDGDAERRVLVVAVDPGFASRIELDARDAMAELIRPLERAAIVVIEPDVNRLALTQLVLSDPGRRRSSSELGGDLARERRARQRAGPADAGGDGIPALDRLIPRTSMAAAAVATGSPRLSPLDPEHPVRTIPVVARPQGGDGPLVPALPIAAVLGLDGRRDGATLTVGGSELVVGGRVVPVEARRFLRVKLRGRAAARWVAGARRRATSQRAASTRPASTTRSSSSACPTPRTRSRSPRPSAVPPGSLSSMSTPMPPAPVLAGEFLRSPSPRVGALVGLGGGVLVALAMAVLPLPLVPVPAAVALLLVWRVGGRRVGDGDPFDLLLALVGVGVAAVVALGWRAVEVSVAKRRTALLFSLRAGRRRRASC